MRCLVIVKATEQSEAGIMPTEDQFREMGAFNERLVKAGVMLAGEGLSSSSTGVRVRFQGDGRTVVRGPFAPAHELVAGYWVWKVESMDEAVEWIEKSPFRDGEVEIRRIAEAEDFGDEFAPDLREQEERLRAELASRQPC